MTRDRSLYAQQHKFSMLVAGKPPAKTNQDNLIFAECTSNFSKYPANHSSTPDMKSLTHTKSPLIKIIGYKSIHNMLSSCDDIIEDM